MNKLDQWLLDRFSVWTIKWIKWRKYLKHKYDLMFEIKVLEACWFVFLGSAGFTLVGLTHSLKLGFQSSLIFLVFITDISFIAITLEQRQDYGFLFLNRKNPLIHQAIKDICERNFERNKTIRQTMLLAFILLAILQVIFVPWFLPLSLTGIYSLYVFAIFDFDEPDENQKAKWEVTELVKRTLERLVERSNPWPKPI